MFGIVLFVLSITHTLAANCTLHFEDKRPGIFWTSFGTTHTLLRTTNDLVHWDHWEEVTGYCPGGFRSDSLSAFPTRLVFSCFGKFLFCSRSEDFAEVSVYSLSCPRTALYYEATIPMCNDFGLAYGFFIEGTPIVLAAVCYDVRSMQSKFLHYVMGPQSSVVDLREDLKLMNLTTDTPRLTMICINIEHERKILAEVIEKSLPMYKYALQFELDDLVFYRESQNFHDAYYDDLKCVNTIPWWKPLKYGNWKAVEEAVANLARHSTYDVYTGISGVVTYPTDEKYSKIYRLTYEVDHHVRKVPLYIWKYIKGRNNDTDQDVVIVGINSPFVHNFDPTEAFCGDMCEAIPWMRQLQITRKFIPLGYVFCCSADEIMSKLFNFPSEKM